MVASTLLFSTGEPAYAVNREGVIVAWNAAAERALGYTESETVGRRCWELLAGRDVFGNRYCCQSCPLHEMAFRRRPIKCSEMFLKTSAAELKKFNISTLVVHDDRGDELLVHLCRPECEAGRDPITTILANRPSANHQRGALSKREQEVLALLSQGNSTAETAAAMCIAPTTVRNHTQHILFKLHVHSRAAAVNMGRKLGLI